MDLKHYLFGDERGVSPVIGVILMVAITVILAGVIGAFVMNMGADGETPPNVQWEWNNETTYFTLEHTGGDAAVANNLVVSVDGTEYSLSPAETAVRGMPDELTAGTTIGMNESSSTPYPPVNPNMSIGNDPADVDEIQLIWENPNSDQTQVITTYDG
ncbi:type IV pilin [Halorhabdus amylolytica]|uniref:type IV pilin n=1 Tax=Halorhabdus amylolytica TaxID=2559573 RepID=UPI0010AA37E6|nr:type IV pilin N-terminal domain-containing protein [Halorhabdus amylolytica]